MRRTVTLANDDTLAALQILANLAYPHRPDFALETLRQWVAHVADVGPRGKWGRVEPKLRRLHDMVKRRLIGAYWLRLQVNERVSRLEGAEALRAHAAGQRECARRFGARDKEAEPNVIRTYWLETRTVAHLGLATGEAILLANSPNERMSRSWDLFRAAFRPDWVGRALQMAETNAEVASRFGVIPLEQTVHFTRRDIF
jgi:hypothetical protein